MQFEINRFTAMLGVLVLWLGVSNMIPAAKMAGKVMRVSWNKLTAMKPVLMGMFNMHFMFVLLIVGCLFLPQQSDTPAPVPEACPDFLDACQDNYRILLADILVKYADKEFTDPEVFDQFKAERDAAEQAAFEPWNEKIQDAVLNKTLVSLSQQMKDKKVQ